MNQLFLLFIAAPNCVGNVKEQTPTRSKISESRLFISILDLGFVHVCGSLWTDYYSRMQQHGLWWLTQTFEFMSFANKEDATRFLHWLNVSVAFHATNPVCGRTFFGDVLRVSYKVCPLWTGVNSMPGSLQSHICHAETGTIQWKLSCAADDYCNLDIFNL